MSASKANGPYALEALIRASAGDIMVSTYVHITLRSFSRLSVVKYQ